MIVNIVNFYFTTGIQKRPATLGNVSEMVHRKVSQTSFRPLLDLSLGYLRIIVVVVVVKVVVVKVVVVVEVVVVVIVVVVVEVVVVVAAAAGAVAVAVAVAVVVVVVVVVSQDTGTFSTFQLPKVIRTCGVFQF